MCYKHLNLSEIRNCYLYFGLFAIALAETVTLSDFKVTSSLAGKACKSEDVIFRYSNRSAVECSAICSENPECTGIFHSYTARSCIGCRIFYTTEASLDNGNGDTKFLYNCAETNAWENFEESRYKLFSLSMNYKDAKEFCQTQCGFPVDLGSTTEVEFVKNLAEDANESSHRDDSNEYPQHRVWKGNNGYRILSLPLTWRSDYALVVYIGLEYDTQTAEWIWGDDGSHPAVTDWSPAEPNGGGSELCVALLNFASINYRWADINCASLGSVVCEKN